MLDGEEQAPKGLKLVRGEMSEGHAVEDPSFPFAGLPAFHLPDHLGLHLDGTAVRLEVDAEEARGGETLVQLQAGAPFTQIAGPACSASGGSGKCGVMQDGELNRVSCELPPLRHVRHGVTPVGIRGYAYRRQFAREISQVWWREGI
jgi:hypothetical protein